MAKSCAIIPKVMNKDGVKVDSRLFKDLLSFNSNNRAETVRQYLITKGDTFNKEWLPKLELDENGEPTIRSLIKKTNLGSIIGQAGILKALNKEIGYYKRGSDRPALIINNDQNYRNLIQKAIRFNTTSDFRDDYVARVINIQDNESSRIFLGVRVVPRTKEYSIEADKMEYNTRLNERLKDILASKGISVGALTELERRLGVSGVSDFDVAKTAADGLIEMIRLAEGERGEKALPEEFAHCAIEMLEGNLTNRLINLLSEKNLVHEILGEDYETYSDLYDKDEARLAREAAGKLLAKHLLNSEPIPQKPYKNLLERVIEAVKSLLKNLGSGRIQRAMREADKQYGTLAKQILDGSLDSRMSVDNIHVSDTLFSTTAERVARDKKLLQDIINNELKRLKVYEGRGRESFDINQRLLIDKLELALAADQEIEGVYTFIDTALEELNKVNRRITSIADSSVPANEKAKVLRDVRNYLFSYKHMAEDIRRVLIDEEAHEDNRYGERARVVLDNLSNLLDDLYIKYTNVSMPIFVDFLKPFLGESLVVPFGKYKGKTISAGELVKIAERDISFFDRWLDSMADSSDYMLKIMDQVVKNSKEDARLRTIDVMKELQAAHIRLEQAGVKGTDWMFEVDSNGKKTGNYISEINYALFRESMRDMYKTLAERYGENPVGEDARAYNADRAEWFKSNMENVGGFRQPKMSIYGSVAFANLNPAQREYYNTVMDIKERLDSYLPEGATKLLSAVKIRKDLLERVKASDSVTSGAKQIWESVKDEFIRRSDDVDFSTKATIKDFEDHEVQNLPIYYTKLKDGESADDISTDVTSTLTAYAAMANDYREMNRVVEVLELGRDLLREREVQEIGSGKPLVERFKIVGRKVESKVIKPKEKSHFMDRLNDFFEMQVYGRYMKDEGTFGESKIDKGKVANFVNRMTSLNSLAVNVLSGISNLATGLVMMRIESFAGEFYSEKDTLIADRNYGKELPAFLAEIGNRVKTSKLALWDELFNVMQEYETDIKNTNFDRKTWFSRMFGTSALFVMNNAGEHWMQNRTSLALANAYKMKAPDGKIVSLWDAMEVVPIDPNNKKLGATLKVKQGYTKEDGSAFTEEDIKAFSRKTTAINQRMHGIYNKLDRSAVQRLAVGRMGIMFRKWIKPALNRRFKSATYNFDLQAWTGGYYKTTGRFLLQLAKELKEGQLALATNWDNLTSTEKANIKRAVTEVAHFLAVMGIIGLIEDGDGDRPWLEKMIEYQARRLYTELGSMIPGPQLLDEGLRILKSPAAGINTIEHTLDLVGLLDPYNYEVFAGEEAVLKSGRYKGESKAVKLFFESPLIPLSKTIYKGLHPEEGIPFFKQ